MSFPTFIHIENPLEDIASPEQQISKTSSSTLPTRCPRKIMNA